MKRKFLLAVAALLLALPLKKALADYEVESTKREKPVLVRYSFSVPPATSTSAVVIDLNDTTNFPHRETGEIRIDALNIEFDKPALSSGTIKLGVVNFVNQSTGSVTYFWGRALSSSTTNGDALTTWNLDNASIRCRVEGGLVGTGTTPFILSNDTLIGSTIYQTDVNLPSPIGNGAPGRGDIVADFTNFGGAGNDTIRFIIEILYHSQSR